MALYRIRLLLKNRLRTDILTCSRCQYDMRACTSLTCPECGRQHYHQVGLYPGRRKILRRLILPAILSLPALWVTAFSLWYFPRAYSNTSRTNAVLQKFNHYAQPCYGQELQPPCWTLFLAQGIDYFRPQIFSMTSSRYSMPPNFRLLGYSRGNLQFGSRPQVDQFFFQTLLNWTWNPSLNYVGYLPYVNYDSITLDSAKNAPLSASDVPALLQIPWLRYLSIRANIPVDDQILSAFANDDRYGRKISIKRFEANPAQVHVWQNVHTINSLYEIHLQPQSPLDPHFLDILAASPIELLSVDAHATPQDKPLIDTLHKLSGLILLQVHGLALDPARLHELSRNTQLMWLTLDLPPGSTTRDQDLTWLSKCGRLGELTLCNMPHVTGAFMSSAPVEINNLSFHATSFDDQGLASLNRLKRLFELHLTDSKVTLAGMKALLRANHREFRTLIYDKPPDLELCQLIASHPCLSTVTLTGVDEPCFQALLAAQKSGMTIKLVSPNLTPAQIGPAHRATTAPNGSIAYLHVEILPAQPPPINYQN